MDLTCIVSHCFLSTPGEHGLYLTGSSWSRDCGSGDVGEQSSSSSATSGGERMLGDVGEY
jgi:hypothetical protein